MESNRYDIAIVGSGPAGLAAAINAKIRNKNIILFGNKNISNKLIKAPKVDNYLGVYDISGEELKDKFKEHIEAMNIEINTKRITGIYAMGEYFSLMSGEEMYEAKKVILATGMEFTKPLKGEEELVGRGVGYCATCDAPLYKEKEVIIVGYNKESEEEANFLSEIASKVYYVPMYRGEYNINSKIKIVKDKPVEIIGDSSFEKLKFQDKEIRADGIFIIKDSVSPAQLVPGLEIEEGHVKVDRSMKTNIEGCYACGDCTGKPYQYMKSTGEGQVAALNVASELDKA